MLVKVLNVVSVNLKRWFSIDNTGDIIAHRYSAVLNYANKIAMIPTSVKHKPQK